MPCTSKWLDRKSTRLNSSHSQISYALFCLKKTQRRARGHRLIARPLTALCPKARPPTAWPTLLAAHTLAALPSAQPHVLLASFFPRPPPRSPPPPSPPLAHRA